MATLGWLSWRSIWAPPKGGKAATVPCIVDDLVDIATVTCGGLVETTSCSYTLL
jgi:hypothetical protein